MDYFLFTMRKLLIHIFFPSKIIYVFCIDIFYIKYGENNQIIILTLI